MFKYSSAICSIWIRTGSSVAAILLPRLTNRIGRTGRHEANCASGGIDPSHLPRSAPKGDCQQIGSHRERREAAARKTFSSVQPELYARPGRCVLAGEGWPNGHWPEGHLSARDVTCETGRDEKKNCSALEAGGRR